VATARHDVGEFVTMLRREQLLATEDESVVRT
jgi:hypothetical protein